MDQNIQVNSTNLCRFPINNRSIICTSPLKSNSNRNGAPEGVSKAGHLIGGLYYIRNQVFTQPHTQTCKAFCSPHEKV